jgi:cytochrome c2
MNRRILLAVISFFSLLFLVWSCINKTPSQEPLDTEALTSNQTEEHGTLITAADVHLTTPLNVQWVAQGKDIYELKCQPCHKLSDEKLVGPGWKGVTQRRKPEWVLNMITNVETMLDKDPQAQKLLEECIVRMPNQNLTAEEARKVLEFQRSNDGEK